MKRRLAKFISLLAIVLLLVTDLSPLANDGTWVGELVESVESAKTRLFESLESRKAHAEQGTYSFLMGSDPLPNGSIIDYSNHDFNLTLNITLQSTVGFNFASGASITWDLSDRNIADFRVSNPTGQSISLDILSPGYTTLSATVTDENGTTYPAAAYCSIYVPLEWDDTNNIKATETDPFGLLTAQTGEKQTTLQMFTDNSDNPNACNHYLRRLKYINYQYTAASGLTGTVPSDVNPDNLVKPTTALTWTVSDPTVLSIDANTGVITALKAGFSTVTVKTNTSRTSNGEGETKSFNVVVVPEAYVVDYTTESLNEFTILTQPGDSDIVVQTNARYATSLSWQLFQGDQVIKSAEITSKYKDNMDISEANGRVTLNNMPAGVYTLTAVSVKDSQGLENSGGIQTYAVFGANIQILKIVIVVTLNFTTDDIILNYYNDNVYDSYDLLGTSNLPEDTFRFTSNDPTVAKVGINDGLIEATGLGETEIVVNKISDAAIKKVFGAYTASAAAIISSGGALRIKVSVVNGIALNTTSETMPLGSNLQLSLTAPNPYEGTITWSTNKDSVATVDETGLVTAVGVGEATITVKIKVRGVTKRARCKVKVISAVNGIQLSAKHDFVEVGDNLTISATISPKVNNTELSWSVSDESIASIADASALSMTITGVKAGTVVVSAVNKENAIVGTMIIKVVQEITGLTLSDTAVTLPLSAGFYQLYATCTPELPSNQSLKWTSSNNSVAVPDANGKVSLKKTGTAVITVVTENGLIASCTFTITQGVTSIALDETDINLTVGESYRMTYRVLPANASNITLKWGVLDSKIATVDQTGYITGKNVGTTVITVQSTDGTGVFTMCTVTVTRAATAIKLELTDLEMTVGETHMLEVILTPADCSDSLSFESTNTKVATVSQKGKISAKAKGTTVIVVKTVGGLTAYCSVNVSQPVTGVKLGVEDAEIYVGDVIELQMEIEPKTASDTDVTWSSDNEEVATVNERGEVKGVGGGIAIIMVITDDGDYRAYSKITVIERVTLIELPEEAEVGVGKKLKLEATVSGERANNKNVKWKTSNKKICKVNKKGVLTGVKKGKCTITVTATDGSGVSAECEVRVITATESIDIDPAMTYIELLLGESKKIKYTTTPTEPTYKPLWTSNDESIAIVNKEGIVTGLKVGSTTVTATAQDDPNVQSIAFIKVIEPVLATNVTMAESEVVMTAGEVKTVPYSITPSNITESYTWSSDNPIVATVNEKGQITAKSMGSATITLMTKSGKTGTVKVFVVGLSRTYVELHQYESLLLRLQVDGAESTVKVDRWDTDNQTIAEISNGTVTGKALGQTKVYAIVKGRKLECTVKVIPNK